MLTNRFPAPLPHKNAIRRSDDPDGIFVTPIVGDEDFPDDEVSIRLAPETLVAFERSNIDHGFAGLDVQLIAVPDLHVMQVDAAVGAAAHVGGRIDPADIAADPGAYLTNDEFLHAGLEQTYEGQVVSFIVSGCSRGFTHEMVRTRNGASYNQQTFRHTDLTNTRFRMPESIALGDENIRKMWVATQFAALKAYELMVHEDVPYEDARTALTIATETWIEVRMPWRTFVDTFAYRACYMFYPEMVAIMHMVLAKLVERDARFGKMLGLTCETSHVCEYRGAEPTSGGQCPFLWAGRRRWMPQAAAMRPDMKYDLPMAEWDASGMGKAALGAINAGYRAQDEHSEVMR